MPWGERSAVCSHCTGDSPESSATFVFYPAVSAAIEPGVRPVPLSGVIPISGRAVDGLWVRLAPALILSPPIDLGPKIVRRASNHSISNGSYEASNRERRTSPKGRYCEFEPKRSSHREGRIPPCSSPTAAEPRTTDIRAARRHHAQRLLGASQREYARQRSASAYAADLPAGRDAGLAVEGRPIAAHAIPRTTQWRRNPAGCPMWWPTSRPPIPRSPYAASSSLTSVPGSTWRVPLT